MKLYIFIQTYQFSNIHYINQLLYRYCKYLKIFIEPNKFNYYIGAYLVGA